MIDDLIVPSNPTPNGDLHIGHVAGPYIGADVLRRAAGQRGERAATVLGTSWQGTHVMLAAQRQGRAYLDVAAEYARMIEDSFAAAGITYDVMLRHADIPDIARVTRSAYTRLRASGAMVVRDTSAHYCTACEAWRFHGFLAGSCPRCGSADAYGIDCEGCGLHHDDAELIDAVCTSCGGRTVLRSLPRAFLELEPQRAWFERYLADVELTRNAREFAEKVLAEPLPAVAMTMPGDQGLPVDDPDVPGQRFYPAFELAPRYAVMVRRLRSAGEEVGAGTRMSMLFGHDNAFERIFLFPAVLRGLASEDAPFPQVMHMTFFYLLEGLKFSTSRRHIVGVGELVEAGGRDEVRLHLAATRPENAPSDFTREAFAGSPYALAVRRLRRWAETGRLPGAGRFPGAGPGDPGRAALAQATAELDEALRPPGLSCVRAANAVLRLTELAADAGHDDAFAAEVLRRIVGGAAALIPETTARLAAAFSVPVTAPPGTRAEP